MGADRVIVALARRRHGVVTRAQLAAVGVTSDALKHRIRRGWLVRVHRGVYQVGPVASARGREMAAVLACGSGAVLSHQTAAALWGIRPPHPGAVHVTIPCTRRARQPGVVAHRAADVAWTRRDGLPLTTAARTLQDLRRVLPTRDVERAREQAEVLRLIPRGSEEPAMTRSEAEARLLALIRAARLPPPRTNVRVHGYEVDLLWPEHRLVVEVDGFAYHSTREAFERDRIRDADLQRHGYRVVRVTWRQIADEPHAVVALLAGLLA